MRLLIVDDDAGLRQSLGLLLAESGYDVVSEGDPEDGLARATSEPFDLILCDVRMPKMDGREFLKRYKAAGGPALVIIISAHGNEELAVEAMREGAYDYLHKPFRPTEVILTLRKAEEREGLRKEVATLRATLESGGGGLVAEPMSRLGAQVTAIDAAERNVQVARAHAAQSGLGIDYRQATAEDLAAAGMQFDVVLALEVIEHVDCLECLRALCKEDGYILLSSPHPDWDWVMKLLERLHLNQRRTSEHSNLTDFETIDLIPVELKRPLFIHQVALFRNSPRS